MTEIVDTDITKVIFRAEKRGKFKGDVTAVFPDMAGMRDHVVCYAHIGQHAECCREWYNDTRPATPKEYSDLKKELETIGYNLKVIKRWRRS